MISKKNKKFNFIFVGRNNVKMLHFLHVKALMLLYIGFF